MRLGAFLGLLLAVTTSVQAGMDVTLKVQESAGVARVADPCRNGVPLVPGAVKDESKLRLLDDKGNEVPAQFRVINRRAEGDIEWVNVAFLADVPAKGAAVYHLTDAGPGKAVDSPVKVDDGADALTVTNGPLKLVLSKKTFAGLGEVWLDRDGKSEQVSKGGALVIEGMDGKIYRSTTDLTAPLKVAIEEQGPLFVVVRIDGEMKAQSADGKSNTYPKTKWDDKAKAIVFDPDSFSYPNQDQSLGFTVRIHVWKGQTAVRTLVTMRNLKGTPNSNTDAGIRYGQYVAGVIGQPGNLQVDAVNFDLDLAGADALKYRIAGGIDGTETHEGKLAAKDDGVTLYQDSSASWVWQVAMNKVFDPLLTANAEWMAANASEDKKKLPYFEYEPIVIQKLTVRDGATFMGYQLFNGAPAVKPGADSAVKDLGKPVAEGMRAPGWVEVDDGKTAVTAGCRWFWQMCPKSIEIRTPGKLSFGLWSRYWSRGHLFEGIGHKTHELVYDFRPSGKGLEPKARFAAFDDHLIAWASDRHNLASRVFGDFPLYPLEGWPRYEQSALAAVVNGLDKTVNPGKSSSYEIEREKHDLYGVWNFGDSNKGEWDYYGQYLELDVPYCLMIHFARTGDMRFFREAERATRELLDVPAHGGGHGHQPGEGSHYYCYGPMLFACAEGEPFLKDSVRSGHREGFSRAGQTYEARKAQEEAPGFIPGPHGGSGYHRSLGISFWSQITMYHYTADPAEQAAYKKGIDAILDCADTSPPGGGTLDFWMGISCDGLAKYCQEFPADKKHRDRLVEVVKMWMDQNKALPADKRLGIGGGWAVGIPLANAFAYASRFSGDDTFFKYAGETFVNDEKFSPWFRTGSACSKAYTEWGHRLCQVWLHDWDKKQHPDRYKDLP
jgi:hypothetical protein